MRRAVRGGTRRRRRRRLAPSSFGTFRALGAAVPPPTRGAQPRPRAAALLHHAAVVAAHLAVEVEGVGDLVDERAPLEDAGAQQQQRRRAARHRVALGDERHAEVREVRRHLREHRHREARALPEERARVVRRDRAVVARHVQQHPPHRRLVYQVRRVDVERPTSQLRLVTAEPSAGGGGGVGAAALAVGRVGAAALGDVDARQVDLVADAQRRQVREALRAQLLREDGAGDAAQRRVLEVLLAVVTDDVDAAAEQMAQRLDLGGAERLRLEQQLELLRRALQRDAAVRVLVGLAQHEQRLCRLRRREQLAPAVARRDVALGQEDEHQVRLRDVPLELGDRGEVVDVEKGLYAGHQQPQHRLDRRHRVLPVQPAVREEDVVAAVVAALRRLHAHRLAALEGEDHLARLVDHRHQSVGRRERDADEARQVGDEQHHAEADGARLGVVGVGATELRPGRVVKEDEGRQVREDELQQRGRLHLLRRPRLVRLARHVQREGGDAHDGAKPQLQLGARRHVQHDRREQVLARQVEGLPEPRPRPVARHQQRDLRARAAVGRAREAARGEQRAKRQPEAVDDDGDAREARPAAPVGAAAVEAQVGAQEGLSAQADAVEGVERGAAEHRVLQQQQPREQRPDRRRVEVAQQRARREARRTRLAVVGVPHVRRGERDGGEARHEQRGGGRQQQRHDEAVVEGEWLLEDAVDRHELEEVRDEPVHDRQEAAEERRPRDQLEAREGRHALPVADGHLEERRRRLQRRRPHEQPHARRQPRPAALLARARGGDGRRARRA